MFPAVTPRRNRTGAVAPDELRDGQAGGKEDGEDSEFQLALELHLGEREDLVHDNAADMRAELHLPVFLRYFSRQGE